MNNITDDNKFDLDVWRTTDQRIEMVTDPDCPRSVLEIVINHDNDIDVILSVMNAKLFDDTLKDLIKKRFNYTDDELQTRYRMSILMRNDSKSHAFCVVPWNHVSTSANGAIRMCCQMINADGLPGEENYGTVFKDDGKPLTASDNIVDHRNAFAWKQLRKEMLEGTRSKLCQLCWDEETNGIGSRRQWSNQFFSKTLDRAIKHTNPDGSIEHKDFPIEHWDLRFGNKCNLACRSCGPNDSDMWYKDWVKLYGKTTFTSRGVGDITVNLSSNGNVTGVTPAVFDWYDNSKLFDYIKDNINSVERFYFTGGEPTINITHRNLLDYVIECGLAKNIILDYNTNMAGVPNAIFNQWKHFKEVNLGMSIDGIYEHFEYIRHPGKWNVIERNLKRIDSDPNLSNVKATFTVTVSIFNVLHVLDMQWWLREQNWNRIDRNLVVHNLYGPEFLNIQNLSNNMKDYITNRYNKFFNDIKRRWVDDPQWYGLTESKLNSILMHMHAVEQNESLYNRWFEVTEQLDTIRNENWKTSLPELHSMIEYCNKLNERAKNVKLARTNKK